MPYFSLLQLRCMRHTSGPPGRLALFLIALALGSSSTLRAHEAPLDWSQTFTMQSLLPYVHEHQRRWTVIAAESDRQTGRAALTLQTALSATGKIEQIVDGEALGSFDRMSDQQIVQRAARLGADTVVVVRLLGGQATAAVNIYNPLGELLATARARVGSALPPPRSESAASDQAGDGEPSAHLNTARQVAEQEFTAQHIGFVGLGPADGGITQTTLRMVTAYQGQNQRRLPPMEFYTLVARPELGTEYERRRRAALRLIIGAGVAGGLSAVAVATTTAYLGAATSGELTTGTLPDTRAAVTAGIAIGGIGTILGLVLLPIGIVKYLDRHPVPTSEALRLAAEYNRQLRRRLGLQAALRESLRNTTVYAAPGWERAGFMTQLRF